MGGRDSKVVRALPLTPPPPPTPLLSTTTIVAPGEFVVGFLGPRVLFRVVQFPPPQKASL